MLLILAYIVEDNLFSMVNEAVERGDLKAAQHYSEWRYGVVIWMRKRTTDHITLEDGDAEFYFFT
jgi:hypothetical protein